MSYCHFNGPVGFYCDWQDSIYLTYQECYNQCLIVAGQVVPLSKSEFFFLMGLAGILAGFLFGIFLNDSTR